MPEHGHVTGALERLKAGDPEAFDELVPLVYKDLRRLARRQMGVLPGGRTLGTTGVVHEAYLKLRGRQGSPWQDRGHFFAVAARAMRHVLIDYAKRRSRQKRGGGGTPVTLDEETLAVSREADHLIAVDEALDVLAAAEPRLARVVECRFFAGLSEEETAEALGVSLRTVQRDWAQARTALAAVMAPGRRRT
jgi:RNA polymerase sigma factor (TIGR02999 family)